MKVRRTLAGRRFAILQAIVFCVSMVSPLTAGALPQAGQTARNAAQSPAARPKFDAFDVATIKPTDPDWEHGRYIRMEGAHEFVVRNHVLRTLIAAAYNLNPKTVSGGPSWVDSDHFDIVAATPGDTPPTYDEQMAMLQKLIADRFDLKFHREQKQMPVYALRLANGGAKLKVSTDPADAFPEGPPPLIFTVTATTLHLPARYASMGELASVFQRAVLDRPVVDETGLTDRYDFDLEFTPDETVFGGAFAGREKSDSDKPGLYTAIQEQLGLKLEAATGPVETLAIDSIEKPSPN